MTKSNKPNPAAFAARHIAFHPELQTADPFPKDIWKNMAKAGLFKIGIPEDFGGVGGGCLDLLKAGEAFVKSGQNLGLALSWLYQQIIARYIVGAFGTDDQRRQHLTAAAKGKNTFSFAVSEPGSGARRTLLATRAVKQDAFYLLSGEKTYLTNGPIADTFIVVAVTSAPKSQKRFTAFIVPRASDGITVNPPLKIPFLQPSPHGGIKLDTCRIGPETILGRKGKAWADMVVPLGEIEDIVMMGPVLGGMAAQLHFLIDAVHEAALLTDPTLPEKLGGVFALLSALRVIAYEGAQCLDNAQPPPTALIVTFSRLAADFHNAVADIRQLLPYAPPDHQIHLDRDMKALGQLKKGLLSIRQKKLGASLLKP